MPARTYATAARHRLELEGVDVAVLRSVTGGDAVGDIVVEAPGPDLIRRKRIAGLRYTDIVVRTGADIDKSLLAWLSDTAAGKWPRKSGAIKEVDYNLNEVARQTFALGLLTEITFPELDAAGKDPAYLTLGITAEQTVRSKGSGARSAATAGAGGKAAKMWLPANFQLSIPGLVCTHVTKVSAVSVRQRVAESAVGELREYQQNPAALEISDVLVTIPESHADSFYAWHDDFVIKGNNDASNEKTGTLAYLTPDSKSTLFTLTLHNLGIYKVGPEPASSADQSPKVTAAMYCEQVEIAGPGSGSAAAPAGGSAAAQPPARTGAEVPLIEGPAVLATSGPLVTHFRRATE
jgi:hypothetical protein